jgi:hypothetical protein
MQAWVTTERLRLPATQIVQGHVEASQEAP